MWSITGQSLSSLWGRKRQDLSLEVSLLSFEPTDRAWLHARIAQRFDQMLASGFVDEVRRLRARGDLKADLPAMRCVGYRQAWQVLDELSEPHAELTAQQIHALRETGIAATRQLAKRQLTWLRSMPQRQVIACDDPNFAKRWMDHLPPRP